MEAIELMPVIRLSKDLAQAGKTLSVLEARYLIDAYYSLQDYRIAAANQVRALSKSGEPHSVVLWLFDQMETLEQQIHRALDKWTEAQELGRWCKGITGIGPVITAGLLAHIDITKAPTVGHIWRFAGLDPTVKWSKGEKRPWNARLKVICWKAGESFVKFSNHPNCFYGHLYQERKAQEQQRNDRGEYAEQAASVLASKNIGKQTEAYKHYTQGKLPPAHIHARASRWTVKLFLAHYHETAYRLEYGQEPPAPYAMAMLGHVHKIEPPG